MAVVEPALMGDKSGSSPTDDKTGTSTDEEKIEPMTDSESTDAITEGEESDVPPGQPEEAKVGNQIYQITGDGHRGFRVPL